MAESDIKKEDASLSLKMVTIDMGRASAKPVEQGVDDAATRRKHIVKYLEKVQPDIVFARNIGAPKSPNWKLDMVGYDYMNSGCRTGLAYNKDKFDVKATLFDKEICGAILSPKSVESLSILCISWHGAYKVAAKEKADALSQLIKETQSFCCTNDKPVSAMVIAGTSHLTAEVTPTRIEDFQLLTTSTLTDHFLYKGLAVEGTPKVEEDSYGPEKGSVLACFKVDARPQPQVHVPGSDHTELEKKRPESDLDVADTGAVKNTQLAPTSGGDFEKKFSEMSVSPQDHSSEEQEGVEDEGSRDDEDTSERAGESKITSEVEEHGKDSSFSLKVLTIDMWDQDETVDDQGNPPTPIEGYWRDNQPDIVLAGLAQDLGENWLPEVGGYSPLQAVLPDRRFLEDQTRLAFLTANFLGHNRIKGIRLVATITHRLLAVILHPQTHMSMKLLCVLSYGDSDRIPDNDRVKLTTVIDYVESLENLYKPTVTVVALSFNVNAEQINGNTGNFNVVPHTGRGKLYFLHKGFLGDPTVDDGPQVVVHEGYQTGPELLRFACPGGQHLQVIDEDGIRTEDEYTDFCEDPAREAALLDGEYQQQ